MNGRSDISNGSEFIRIKLKNNKNIETIFIKLQFKILTVNIFYLFQKKNFLLENLKKLNFQELTNKHDLTYQIIITIYFLESRQH